MRDHLVWSIVDISLAPTGKLAIFAKWHYNNGQLAKESEFDMTYTARIVKFLGGERALGRKISAPGDLIPVVRSGLRYQSFEALLERLKLSREQALEALALPRRTMARRKEESRLSADESDRLYRLARIAARAEEVLGASEQARRWLVEPNRALGSVAPLSLLDTDEGARQVEAILGRIEHGVFS